MGQTRLAVIEDNALCELYYDRPGLENLSGNIYLGRVVNVLPGMNAAFVDIGLDKNAFLTVGDIQLDVRENGDLARELSQTRIEARVRPSQEIPVQVVKSGTGQKGPRVSCYITLPGRTMVLMPNVRYIGVSRKIAEAPERGRLRAVAHELLEDSGMGLIMRTASAGMDAEVLAREYEGLVRAWREIESRAKHDRAPKRIHSGNSLELRVVRDMLSEQVDAVWVDDEGQLSALQNLARAFAPQWLDRIRLHTGSAPLFDLYRVDDQLEKAMRKYVWLKSGGSLVIEETEALTVIDVNTGKYVGKKSLDDTIYKNNCEAAREIMRQLRLRDLGGIIIVDFIDMTDAGQKEKLLELLRDLATRDRNHVNVVGITGLGLVEMTRKKQRQPLSKQLMHICSSCGGNGVVPSYETIARRVAREIWRRRRSGQGSPLLVEVTPPVASYVQRIGMPEGGGVYLCPSKLESDEEYRVSPADPGALPDGAKLLK